MIGYNLLPPLIPCVMFECSSDSACVQCRQIVTLAHAYIQKIKTMCIRIDRRSQSSSTYTHRFCLGFLARPQPFSTCPPHLVFFIHLPQGSHWM